MMSKKLTIPAICVLLIGVGYFLGKSHTHYEQLLGGYSGVAGNLMVRDTIIHFTTLRMLENGEIKKAVQLMRALTYGNLISMEVLIEQDPTSNMVEDICGWVRLIKTHYDSKENSTNGEENFELEIKKLGSNLDSECGPGAVRNLK